jgi:hypothetical protein
VKHSYDDDFFDDETPRRRSSRSSIDFEDDELPTSRRKKQKPLREPRNDADQAFKCGHCKQFIGAPIMGGRQRNHCPNCLYSKHVDHTRPGDRRSTCHSLMVPIGIVRRRNEDVLIHRCLGCGKEDPNRIAADDNPVLLDEMPIIEWNEFSMGSSEAFDAT